MQLQILPQLSNFEQHLDLNSGNLTEKAFKHFAIRQPIWPLPPPAEREAHLEHDDIFIYDGIPPLTPTATVLAPAAATAATTSLASMPMSTYVQQSQVEQTQI